MPSLKVKALKFMVPVKASVRVVCDEFWAKGDVNRDGIIDSLDMDRVKALFGRVRGDPDFDSDCDLNQDGKIDMKDIGLVTKNQGLTVPEYTTPFSTEVPTGKCSLHGVFKTQEVHVTTEITGASKATFMFGLLKKAFVRKPLI